MIKDINRIKKSVSKAFGLSTQTLDGGHRIGTAAQGQAMFAYLSHLSNFTVAEIASSVGCSSNMVYTLIDCARSCYATSPNFKNMMDSIRHKLGIELFISKKDKQTHQPQKSVTNVTYHPPFCKYTLKEECMILDAMQDAACYMESYGKGVQPLVAGFATIRKKS